MTRLSRHTMRLALILTLVAVPLGIGAKTAAQEEPPASADEQQAEAFDEKEPVTAEEKASAESLKKRACPEKQVGFNADTDKTTHPTPTPKEGKALVYVLRPTMMGNKIQTKLAVDGEWKGVNRGHNYFFLDLDPGEHLFCSKSENASPLALQLEAGRTYYLEQKIKMGIMKARNKLALLSEAEGERKLAKCHPSVFSRKD